ncbi:hypothetical protein MKZ15_23805 [Paenibacillus sp. FSL R7-0216]|uniref:hypothetical protein n=1 Tax=Paenibacillus sp. FSL R7-0216 TaxID=2921677 RepID=UPI0030D74438
MGGLNKGVTWITRHDNTVKTILVDNHELRSESPPYAFYEDYEIVFEGSYKTLENYSIFDFPANTAIKHLSVDEDINNLSIDFWFKHQGNNFAIIIFRIHCWGQKNDLIKLKEHYSIKAESLKFLEEPRAKYFEIYVRVCNDTAKIPRLILLAKNELANIREILKST